MKLIPVETVPRRKSSRHDLQNLIVEFMDGDADIVKIDLGEHDYRSAKVCRSCLGAAVKRAGYPIKVMLREDIVYLKKM